MVPYIEFLSTVPLSHKIGELNTQVTSGFYTHRTHNGRTGIGKPLQEKGEGRGRWAHKSH